MSDTARIVDIIAGVVREWVPAVIATIPGGGGIPLVVLATDETVDDRDPAALCRIDAQDGITMMWPYENSEPTTMLVAFTVTLRRADIPSLVTADRRQMRAAVSTCLRVVQKALIYGFERANGQLLQDSLSVRTPSEMTVSEPDTDVEATVTSGTVTAVFPIDDTWILTSREL